MKMNIKKCLNKLEEKSRILDFNNASHAAEKPEGSTFSTHDVFKMPILKIFPGVNVN